MLFDETSAAIGCKKPKDLKAPVKCSQCDYVDFFGTMYEHKKLHAELNKSQKISSKSRHKVHSCPFGEYVTNSGNMVNHMSKKHYSFKADAGKYCFPLYEKKNPGLKPSHIWCLIARDWLLGKPEGLEDDIKDQREDGDFFNFKPVYTSLGDLDGRVPYEYKDWTLQKTTSSKSRSGDAKKKEQPEGDS